MHPYKAIYFSDTMKRANDKAQFYNSQQTNEFGDIILRHCIRKQHLQLFEVVVRRLSKKKYIHSRLGLMEVDNLVWCNNRDLAKILDCSTKTIYNLFERLETAGFITKVFHGAKFQYEIHVCKELLTGKYEFDHAELQKNIEKEQLEAAEMEIENSVFAPLAPPANEKTLPNNIKTRNYNNVLISHKVELVENSVNSVSTSSSLIDEPGNHLQETPGKLNTPGQRNNPPVAPPPQKSVKNVQEIEEIRGMVSDLWAFTFTKLYSKVNFMAAGQIIAAQGYFAKALLNEPDSESRKKKLKELTERIYIAQNVANKPGKFIPLPIKYFNPDNKKGFKNTRNWWLERKEQKAKLQLVRDEYQYSVNLFRKFTTVCNGVDIMSISSYKRGLKQLEATGLDELVDAYHEIVMEQFKQLEN